MTFAGITGSHLLVLIQAGILLPAKTNRAAGNLVELSSDKKKARQAITGNTYISQAAIFILTV
jgi:hypothetical protein